MKPLSTHQWIKISAIALAGIGLLNILSAWFSFDMLRLHLLHQMFNHQLIRGSRFLVVFAGILAFIIAPSLYRRKRIAWYFAVITLGLAGLGNIIKGADVEEASLCLLLTGILLPLQAECSVKSDPWRMQQGVLLFSLTLGFVFLYTLLGVVSFSDALGISSSPAHFLSVLGGIFSFDISMLHPVDKAARFFASSILWINGFLLLFALILLLAPVLAQQLEHVNEEKSREIAKLHAYQPVHQYVTTSNYFHWIYNANNKEGFIGYSLVGRMAMALGNPCGNANRETLLRQWMEFVTEHDWFPAIYQADETLLPIAKKYGFDSIPIGSEAVINLQEFTVQGKSMQPIRTALNKVQKNIWRIRPYAESDWPVIDRMNQQWLKIHGTNEIPYAMGVPTEGYLASTRCRVLVDQNDRLLGYVSNVEMPENNSRGLDVMRRQVDAPSGIMDALILHEILAAKEEGRQFYDLGLSPLALIRQAPSDNRSIVRLLNLFYKKQKKHYDFQGLYLFKAKFNPQWQPRYLLYPSTMHLPTVLLGLMRLNQGRGAWKKLFKR